MDSWFSVSAISGAIDMDNSLKSKVTGWGATVGLAALALLGNVGGNAQAAVTASDETVADKTASSAPSAAITTTASDGSTYQIAGGPPPPPPPPAVGATRG
jgi:hypothetical protein